MDEAIPSGLPRERSRNTLKLEIPEMRYLPDPVIKLKRMRVESVIVSLMPRRHSVVDHDRASRWLGDDAPSDSGDAPQGSGSLYVMALHIGPVCCRRSPTSRERALSLNFLLQHAARTP